MSGDEKLVYRYRPMIESYDFRAIEDGYLWFSNPSAFNDAFEHRYRLSFDLPNPQEDYSRFKIFNDRYGVFSLKEQVLAYSEPELFKRRYEEGKEIAFRSIEAELEKSKSNKRCCCFNKLDNELLMWGYYANGMQGLVLGFDRKILEQAFGSPKVFREVDYSKNDLYPQIDVISYLCDGSDSTGAVFDAMYSTKSLHWEHEQELRVLANAENLDRGNEFYYPKEALKKIIFGELMAPQVRERIESLFEEGSVQFSTAKRSSEKYLIEIESH